jgi:hypothetical protein
MDDQIAAEGIRLPTDLTGGKHFCATRSYLSTAVKQGKHFLRHLICSSRDVPGYPQFNDLTSYPSLEHVSFGFGEFLVASQQGEMLARRE